MLFYIYPILSVLKHDSMELLFVEIKTKQCPLLLGLFYRPPSNVVDFSGLESALGEHYPSKLRNAVLLGDFTIDLLQNSKPLL